MSENTLNITEIFYSIQGEALEVGLPTVFIRLTGCPLRCGYCDTTYAFKGNNPMTIDQIIEKVREFPTHQVCVTGGEPLAQKMYIYCLMTLLKISIKSRLRLAEALISLRLIMLFQL